MKDYKRCQHVTEALEIRKNFILLKNVLEIHDRNSFLINYKIHGELPHKRSNHYKKLSKKLQSNGLPKNFLCTIVHMQINEKKRFAGFNSTFLNESYKSLFWQTLRSIGLRRISPRDRTLLPFVEF